MADLAGAAGLGVARLAVLATGRGFLTAARAGLAALRGAAAFVGFALAVLRVVFAALPAALEFRFVTIAAFLMLSQRTPDARVVHGCAESFETEPLLPNRSVLEAASVHLLDVQIGRFDPLQAAGVHRCHGVPLLPPVRKGRHAADGTEVVGDLV